MSELESPKLVAEWEPMSFLGEKRQTIGGGERMSFLEAVQLVVQGDPLRRLSAASGGPLTLRWAFQFHDLRRTLRLMCASAESSWEIQDQ